MFLNARYSSTAHSHVPAPPGHLNRELKTFISYYRSEFFELAQQLPKFPVFLSHSEKRQIDLLAAREQILVLISLMRLLGLNLSPYDIAHCFNEQDIVLFNPAGRKLEG